MKTDQNSVGIMNPKWIVLQLVEKCNLRCKMCYEWGNEGSYHEKENLAELDLEVAKSIIEEVSADQPFFGLFGGEPLMYPHIREVLELLQEKQCLVDIPTNGTLLEEYAEMLVETKPNRLWISLDGPEEINDAQRGRGVYRRVVKGINKIHEVRESKGSEFPKIGLTFIVTPFNYTYIEKMFLEDIDLSKIDHLSIEFQLFTSEQQCEDYEKVLSEEFGIQTSSCARGLLWDLEEFKQIDVEKVVSQIKKVEEYCSDKEIHFITYPKTITVENLTHFYHGRWDEMADRRNKCAFPWAYAEVSARGDVTSCHTFYDVTHGNVYNNSFMEIWKGQELQKFRKYIKKQLFPICTSCSRYYRDPNKK